MPDRRMIGSPVRLIYLKENCPECLCDPSAERVGRPLSFLRDLMTFRPSAGEKSPPDSMPIDRRRHC